MSLEILILEPRPRDRTFFHAGSIIDHMGIPVKPSLKRSRFEHHYLIVHSIPRTWIKAIELLPLKTEPAEILDGGNDGAGCCENSE